MKYFGGKRGYGQRLESARLLKNLVENLFNTGIENISGLIEM